jgi:hypothetical protein
MARVCVFCGARADSREHIFPDWLNDLLIGDEFQTEYSSIQLGQIAEERKYPSKRGAGHRSRVVCTSCNNHWMSDLEKAAKPILVPMILGQQTVLTMAEQLSVACWAIKTAMVGDAITQSAEGFTQEDRDLMRARQQPAMRTRVTLAAYALDEPIATRYVRGAGKLTSDTPPLTDLDVCTHTIQVVHLVLAVRGTYTLPASDNRALENIAEPRYLEIPVWAPVEKCRWPPGLVMDNAMLIEYSGGNKVVRSI